MLLQMDNFFELFMMAGESMKLDGFTDISDSQLDTKLVVFRMTAVIGCRRAHNMDKQILIK